MVEAIAQELFLQKNYLNNELIESIYFGGGTPSLLSAEEIDIILTAIDSSYDLSEDVEICLEANPDDLSEIKLSQFFQSGINRLSIGIQSFDDGHLTYLNRSHDSKAARSCVAMSRSVGIDNISIDLMYAIPSESHDIWKQDLAMAVAIRPPHISLYSLTIESQTVFGKWLKKGRISPVDEEYAAQQFEILLDFLGSHGYEQYEVSNFCLPNKYSIHNSNYWKQKKYLGVGPGAHSYNGDMRQYNVSHNKQYLDAITCGKVPFTRDALDSKDHVNEYLLTTLRTKWGTSLNLLYDKYGYDLRSTQEVYLGDLHKRELIRIDNDILTLTDKGKLFADKIASDLFLI